MSKKSPSPPPPSPAKKTPMAKAAPTHHLDLDSLDDALGGFDMLSVAKGGGALEALRSQAASPPTGEPLQLPIDRVKEDPNQPRRRFDPVAQKELEASVRQIGIKSPLSVKSPAADGTYLLNFGARRLRAARAAGLATVPAFIDDNHDEFAQVVENEQRDNLTTMDLARFVGEKMDAGYSQVEIAGRLSKSKTWVAKYAALNKIPGWLAIVAEAGKFESVDALYDLASYLKKNPEGEGDAKSLCESEKVSLGSVRAFVSDRKPAPVQQPEVPPAQSAPQTPITIPKPAAPQVDPVVSPPEVSGPKLSITPDSPDTPSKQPQEGWAESSRLITQDGKGQGTGKGEPVAFGQERGNGFVPTSESSPDPITGSSHSLKNNESTGPLPVIRFSTLASEAEIVTEIQMQRSKAVTRFIVEIVES